MEKTYSYINEKVYSHTCPGGLRITVIPKAGFEKTYAFFAANFGSVDSHFLIGDREIILPDGVAHFLEHKMFEQPDGNDAFTIFSKYGAQANAFTSFDMTSYLFSTSDYFDECLKHLISFVSTPYFTKENVAKEQGIISQEIKMYEDDPSWSVFFNSLRAMYGKHSIKNDIAGSVASISEITPEILYDCYNAYYNQKNMYLCVVGKADPDSVFKIAESILSKSTHEVGKTVISEEDKSVKDHYIEKNMDVSLPLFTVAFKEVPQEDKLKAEALYSVALDALFGKSSSLYNELYNEGLITSLSASYNWGKKYAFAEIGGESPEPKAVYERITNRLNEIREKGFEPSRLEISKKSLYGSFIKGLNSIENIAHSFVSSEFFGQDYFSYGERLLSVSTDDIDALIKNSFEESVLSAVYGGEKN